MGEPMGNCGTLTVDLGAIVENWRRLDRISGPAETAAVVKANAYGLGADRVGPALAAAGVRSFFVAHLGEAIALRQALEAARPSATQNRPAIYILNGLAPDPDAVAACAEHALWPVLNTAEDVAEIGQLAARGSARLGFALQLDTGMNRLGMEPDAWGAFLKTEIAALTAQDGLRPRLVMSHMACADEPAHPMNAAQQAAFLAARGAAAAITQGQGEGPGGWERLPWSLAATGATLLGPRYHFDMVRPGIGLFGGLPFKQARPAVELDVPILQVRDVAPGEAVGYGASWIADGPRRIATISAGYADGLHRLLSNRAAGFIAGIRCPIAGRVSMDLICLDVTDAPEAAARPGGWVEIIGPNQGIDTLATQAETIGYEVLTGLGLRYRRIYREAATGVRSDGGA